MAQRNAPQAETLSGSPQPNFTGFAPKAIVARRTPTTADTGYAIGQSWVDKVSGDAFILVQVAAGVATWSLLGAGSGGPLNTLSDDAATNVSPVAGDIQLDGVGNQIATTAGVGLITLSIPATFIAPGSIASTTTITAGTTVTSTTGMVAGTTLTSAGATTLATTGASVNTFGNATGATSVTITSGTGGVALASTGTGDITIDSDDTLLLDADGVLELNSSAGVIGIGNDADAQNINIGTGAAARVITIGNVTGASQVVLNSGTAGVAVNTTGAGDVVVTSADTVLIDGAGVVEINSSAGAIGIGNDAVAQAINVGTGAAARTITVGNVTGATGLVLNSGTGGVAVNTTTTGDIVMTSADTVLIDSAGVLELNSSAGVIGIGNDAVAQNINVGTGAAARVITVGNVTGATAVVVNSGTGGVAINTTTTGDVVVTSADTVLIDSAGVLELNSSAGVIGIGNDAVAQNINVGTGAAARTITVGNATGATSVVVNAGTGAATFASNATAHATTVGSTTGASATTINSGTGNLTLVGNVLKSTSPAFLGYLAATANNKTGDGTSYTLGTDALTQVYDRDGGFNVNGTFTAAVTGIYDLRAQVTVTGNTIATTFIISIVTTARTYIHTFIKAAGNQDETVAISALADMTATDTATVTIVVNGEAGATSDILGAATLGTYFCGALVA